MCRGFIGCQRDEKDAKAQKHRLHQEIEQPKPEKLGDFVADVVKTHNVEERQCKRQRRHQQIRNLIKSKRKTDKQKYTKKHKKTVKRNGKK